LRRIERLFCRNERAVIHGTMVGTGARIALVPVAAILVASIRLQFANVLLHLKYRGPNPITCNHDAIRGQELGWFEHGSTIIVLAPRGFTIHEEIQLGKCIRMGVPLMRTPPDSPHPVSNVIEVTSNCNTKPPLVKYSSMEGVASQSSHDRTTT
jgi:phosphatidylserine decarboxylase